MRMQMRLNAVKLYGKCDVINLVAFVFAVCYATSLNSFETQANTHCVNRSLWWWFVGRLICYALINAIYHKLKYHSLFIASFIIFFAISIGRNAVDAGGHVFHYGDLNLTKSCDYNWNDMTTGKDTRNTYSLDTEKG